MIGENHFCNGLITSWMIVLKRNNTLGWAKVAKMCYTSRKVILKKVAKIIAGKVDLFLARIPLVFLPPLLTHQ